MHRPTSSYGFAALLTCICIVGLAILGYWGLGNPTIYQSTVGTFNLTYSRDSAGQVHLGHRAFAPYDDTNALRFDADIYHAIRLHLYDTTAVLPHVTGRPAFFPGFPLVWRLSQLSPAHVFWLNLGLALLGFWLLMLALLPPDVHRAGYGWLLLLFPSWVVFAIPYAEALWLFCGGLAVWGAVRRQYGWLALGLFGLGFTRAAVTLVIPAILAVECWQALVLHRDWRLWLRRLVAVLSPLGLGFGAVLALQWLQTGDHLAYVHSQFLWQSPTPGLHRPWWDWSREGYWMSAVLIGGLLPLGLVWGIGLLLRTGRNRYWASEGNVTARPMLQMGDYILAVLVLYSIVLLLSRLYNQGGVLVGYHRYTLAAPLGVAGLMVVAYCAYRLTLQARIGYTLAILAGLGLLAWLGPYGKGGIMVHYSPGILTLLLLLAGIWWLRLGRWRVPIGVGLTAWAMLIWWNLLNQFLVNAWLFL
jgi:hypothetical protein